MQPIRALCDAVMEFLQSPEVRTLVPPFPYIWFGLLSGPAPKFLMTVRRDDCDRSAGARRFSEILSSYYRSKIRRLWRDLAAHLYA